MSIENNIHCWKGHFQVHRIAKIPAFCEMPQYVHRLLEHSFVHINNNIHLFRAKTGLIHCIPLQTCEFRCICHFLIC